MLSVLVVGDHLAMPTTTSNDVDRAFSRVKQRRERRRILPALLRYLLVTSLHADTHADSGRYADALTSVLDIYIVRQNKGTNFLLCAAFQYPTETGEFFTYSRPKESSCNSVCLILVRVENFTIRYETRCYFNVRSKAIMSQLNLPHGTDN